MISTLFPAFLAGGVGLAGIALALHMLSRRPPDRRPLPTARFLEEEHRTLLRLRRTPSDIPLLITRMLFALMLGAAFAGISWAPERSGTRRFVLVDVAGVSTDGVDAMLTAVDAALAEAAADSVAVEVIGYAVDADGSLLTSANPEVLVSSAPRPRATAANGLQALSRAAFDAATLDSVEVTWIMRPDWAQWTKGVGLLREAFWSGAIELTPIWRDSPEQSGLPTTRIRAATTATEFGGGAALGRALAALDVPLAAEFDVDASWTFSDRPAAGALAGLVERARSGQTVVISGALPQSLGTAGPDLPWDASVRPDGTPSDGRVVLAAGYEVSARVPRAPGSPTRGSRVIALFDDLSPAASSRPVGDGCIVYSAASLAAPALEAASGFVELVADLLFGCADSAGDALPLDPGALSALRRDDLPTRVALANMVDRQSTGAERRTPGPGRSLTPLFLLLALVMLGAEVWLTRERRS